jgi:hypothetical protein
LRARTFLCRALIVAILSVALIAPARAESLETVGKQITAGIVVVSAAVAVVVILLVIHYKHKKSSITGCVASGASGMNLTDEKDKRLYTLSGDTAAVKAGDRMTLEGIQRKEKGAAPVSTSTVFEVQKVRDLGACQP